MGAFDDLPDAAPRIGAFDDLPDVTPPARGPLFSPPTPQPAIPQDPGAVLAGVLASPIPTPRPVSVAEALIAPAVDESLDLRAGRGFGRSAYGSQLHTPIPGDILASVQPPTGFEGESAGELLTRRGQEFAGGVSGIFQSALRARSIESAALEQAINDQAPDQVKQAHATAQNIGAVLDSGVSPLSGAPLSGEELATYKQRFDDALTAVEAWSAEAESGVTPVESRSGARTAKALQEWTTETFGEPPQDDSFWSKLAQGAGSMVGFAVPAAVAGPGGLAVSAQLGADAARDEAFQSAVQSGASERDALISAEIARFVGYSEVLPIGSALSKLPDPIKNRIMSEFGRFVSGRVGNVAGAALTNSVEEAVQEGGNAIMQNLIAQNVYDPDRQILNAEVGEQALVGAVLGGIMGGGVASVQRRPEQPPEQQPTRAPERPPTAPTLPPAPQTPETAEVAPLEGGPAAQQAPQAEGAPERSLAARAAAPQPAGRPNLFVPQPEEAPQPGRQAPSLTQPSTNAPSVEGRPESPAIPEEPAPREPQAPLPRAGEPQAERRRTVKTPSGESVETDFEVVEADDLVTSDMEAFPQELQPRDRNRAASRAQIEQIANAPDPTRLFESAESDRGAPIIGPDGVVESGNGRVMALRLAAQRGTIDSYRQFIAEKFPEAAGMKNPVLVRRRVTEVDRRSFTRESNVAATLSQSATERAQTDSDSIDLGMLERMSAAAVNATGNRDVVREFFGRLPATERGALMTADGGLSVEGQTRFQNALFHKAYGSEKILQRLTESPDQDARGVTNGLLDAAVPMARLRERIAQKQVREDLDPSSAIQEAVDAFNAIRADQGNLNDFRSQGDSLFGEGISPEADIILGGLFDKDGKRPAIRKAVSDFMNEYVRLAEAERVDQTDAIGRETTSVAQIAGRALDKTRKTDEGQKRLLERGQRRLADAAAPARREGGARQEVRDTEGRQERGDSGDVTTRPPGQLGKTTPKSGTLTPKFLEFSFANRNSVYADAAKAAGYTPEKFALLHADKQVSELSATIRRVFGVNVRLPTRTIVRKTVTGRTTTETRERISPRDAIDQLLDAYRQFKMMTHVLGLPNRAVALMAEGDKGAPLTLALTTPDQVGALGSYVYSTEGPATTRTIALPDRSNSFAHEWGHGLDHWLMMQLRKDKDPIELLTRDAFNSGFEDITTNPQKGVRRAFVQALQALFTDRGKLAAMHISLQVEATRIDPKTGALSASAKQAQKTLDDIRNGKAPPPEVRNRFFKTSEEFENMVGMQGYFTDPAEMWARAFEAYISARVGQVSDLPQDFLTKGDWAYSTSEDTRASMTFPRGVDGEKIFIAFDELFHQLRNAALFGTDTSSEIPESSVDYDVSQWHLYKDDRGLLARERDAWARAEKTERAVKARSPAKKLGDAFHSAASTFGGYLHRLVDRQPPEAQTALRNLLDEVVTDPGRDRVQKKVWEEAVERESKSSLNLLDNIVRAHRIAHFTNAQTRELFRLLNGSLKEASTASVEKAAAALRGLLNERWRYVRNSGIKVGFVKSGWLPRILDHESVAQDANGFRSAAKKVYGVVFKNEVRNATPSEQVEDVKRLVKDFRQNVKPTEEGELAPDPLLTDADMREVEKWNNALREVKALQKRLMELKQPAAKARVEAELKKAAATFKKLHADMLDKLETIFVEKKAEHWYLKSQLSERFDFETRGPDGRFMKARTLPEETDGIMEKYLVSDPLHLIQQYLQQAPKRVEYVRRFGPQGEKIANFIRAAQKAGADAQDLAEIRESVELLTGRIRETKDPNWAWIGGWVYTVGTVTLLKRAFWSSLAESFVAGLRTGHMRDSFSATARLIGQLARTKDAKQRTEVARIIGLVTSGMFETVMHNRMGGDFDPSGWQSRFLTGFFVRTGLTGLTNLQRTAVLGTSSRAVQRLLEYTQKGSDTRKQQARAELHELGVADEQMADLSEWLSQFPRGVPSPEALLGPDGGLTRAGEVWSNAAARLTEQIIQNPKRFDRPKLAQLHGYRMMFGIMGFIYSFHRNVLLPVTKRHIEPKRPDEGAAHYFGRQLVGTAANLTRKQAGLPMAFGALFMAHLLTTMVREALLNGERWEEKEKDGELEEWLIQRALFRTGVTGAFDPALNLFAGVRYERDLTSAFAGAHAGWVMDTAQDLSALYYRNSPNTNTAERNAAKTATKLLTGTGGAMALSVLPGGPLLSPVYGAGIWASDSPFLQELAADAIVGPSDRKKK